MAIQFTKRDPTQWETWIPDYQGERELYKTAPEQACSVDIKFMTLSERKRHERIAEQMLRGKITDDEGDAYMAELFASHVRNVRNFSDGETSITEGPALLKFLVENGESNLAFQITEAIAKRSRLEDGLAKKLRSGSAFASQHQKTSASGDAQDAIPESAVTTLAGPTKQILSYDSLTKQSGSNGDATKSQTPLPTNGRQTSSDALKAS